MPFVVFGDRSRRRLDVSANGTLIFDDFDAILRLRTGDARDYTVLFDVSGATPEVSASEVHSAADRVKDRAEREGPRGRFAIVAGEEAVFGLAQAYVQMCQRPALD